jgi:hypothetical protein
MKEFASEIYPTYIENWPQPLAEISIPTELVSLSREDVSALINTFEVANGDGDPVEVDLSGLMETLQSAIDKFPNGAFVRLGSRSPKDSWTGHRKGFRVTTAQEALELLIDSERVWDDLVQFKNLELNAYIAVREWLEIPMSMEFRCFMRAGELVGISQYDYTKGDRFPEVVEKHDAIKGAIEAFFPSFAEACHLDSVVFDVFIRDERGDGELTARLLEINPFNWMTDPCLFEGVDLKELNAEFRFIGTAEEGGMEDRMKKARADKESLLAALKADLELA